jgi:hypothetical protein
MVVEQRWIDRETINGRRSHPSRRLKDGYGLLRLSLYARLQPCRATGTRDRHKQPRLPCHALDNDTLSTAALQHALSSLYSIAPIIAAAISLPASCCSGCQRWPLEANGRRLGLNARPSGKPSRGGNRRATLLPCWRKPLRQSRPTDPSRLIQIATERPLAEINVRRPPLRDPQRASANLPLLRGRTELRQRSNHRVYFLDHITSFAAGAVAMVLETSLGPLSHDRAAISLLSTACVRRRPALQNVRA